MWLTSHGSESRFLAGFNQMDYFLFVRAPDSKKGLTVHSRDRPSVHASNFFGSYILHWPILVDSVKFGSGLLSFYCWPSYFPFGKAVTPSFWGVLGVFVTYVFILFSINIYQLQKKKKGLITGVGFELRLYMLPTKPNLTWYWFIVTSTWVHTQIIGRD